MLAKYLIVGLLVGFHSGSMSQINIRQQANFHDLLKDAKKAHKKIFLLCCTEWCAPCKELEDVFFKDSALAKYLDRKYIVGKFDMEKKGGIPIAKKYGILQYPTAVIVDSDGFLYYKFIGITSSPISYLSTLRYYDSLYSTRVSGVSNKINMRFPDFYHQYFNEKIKKKPDSALISIYLSKQGNLKTEIVWRIMNQFECGDYYDKYILENLKEFVDLYGVEARVKANAILDKFIKNAIASSDKKQYLAALKFMEFNNIREQSIIEAKIIYHLEFRDYSGEFADLLKNYVNKNNRILSRVCDSLFYKRNIKGIDEIMIEQLEYKISQDTSSIWRLYGGLFKEKMLGVKLALPYYNSYLQSVPETNRVDAIERLFTMRDKLNFIRNSQ